MLIVKAIWLYGAEMEVELIAELWNSCCRPGSSVEFLLHLQECGSGKKYHLTSWANSFYKILTIYLTMPGVRCVHEQQSNRVEIIIWKIMEWSIQVATGSQRAINWQGVEIAIKSLLDLYI